VKVTFKNHIEIEVQVEKVERVSLHKKSQDDFKEREREREREREGEQESMERD
jgi:hypothetical protein